jgi:hypothetical protein
MFVDVEHALDPSYSKAIGVNMETLYVSQPGSGEEALEIADTMVPPPPPSPTPHEPRPQLPPLPPLHPSLMLAASLL